MARPRLRATLASATIIVALLAPAAAQEPGFLDRLFGDRDRGAPQSVQERTPQVSGQEMLMRIDRLENYIRQLTGQIEQLQYRNQQLENQVRRIQEDTEYRFQELGGKPGSRPTTPTTQTRPPAPPQSGPPSSNTGKRGDAFDPTLNPNAPGVPRSLGGGSGNLAGTAPIESEPPPIGAPGGRDSGAPLDLATLAPPGGAGQPTVQRGNPNVGSTAPTMQSPKDEFDFAYGYVVRKDYASAEERLRAFIEKYPNDRLAAEATYWLGESLFQRQRYRDAAEAFLNVSTKFDGAGKAPDALFRLGQSLAALGETEAACASLGEVLRKYPRASASVKQAVEREQKRVRC